MQITTSGFALVSAKVIKIVLHDEHYWDYLQQPIDVYKPLVDAIGNVESCDATLADCMLELM